MSLDSSINKILESGLLGAIIIVLGFTVFYLYREVDKAKSDRLNDWMTQKQEDIKVFNEIKMFMQRITDLLQGKND